MSLGGKWLQSNGTELELTDDQITFGGETYPKIDINDTVCFTEGAWRGRWYYILRPNDTLLIVHGNETTKATKKDDGKYTLMEQELLVGKSEKKEDHRIVSYDETTWECAKISEVVTEQRFGRDGCIWYYCETKEGDLEVFSRSLVSLSYKAERADA